MSRASKADKELVKKAVQEGTVRGLGPNRFAMLPRWVGPRDGGVAAAELLGEPAEFSHLALGYYPIYRVRGES